jgi:hypothetical protein
MITLSVVAKVTPRKQQEFLQSVRSLTGNLNKKGSTEKPILYQEVDDQTVFNLVCELRTKEDLRKLLSSEEFEMLRGAFKLLCEKSKIRCKYNCRNRPRHACATHEPLNAKSAKDLNRKVRTYKLS